MVVGHDDEYLQKTTGTEGAVSGNDLIVTISIMASNLMVGTYQVLSRSLFFVNQYFSGVGACYVIYYNSSRKLIMLQNDGNNVVSPNGQTYLTTTPRASQVAANSQCSMDLGQITYTDPGTNDVTLHFPMTFFPAFQTAGPQQKGVYSYPIDRASQAAGTSPVGTWTVAPAPPPPDFSMTVTPTGSTVGMAKSATPVTYTVNVAQANSFSGTVTLGAVGLPGGAIATFNPPTITGSGSSTMTVAMNNVAVASNFAFSVVGQRGLLNHSATGSISVQDFVFTVSPTY